MMPRIRRVTGTWWHHIAGSTSGGPRLPAISANRASLSRVRPAPTDLTSARILHRTEQTPGEDDNDACPKDQILAASGGMLKKQFYVVFSTPANGIAPVMENLAAHLAHQCEIERRGILLAAGPNWNDDEQFWDGDGMFVIRANSLARAKEIAASDPMHKAGARTFMVRPWLVNEGGLVIRASFSDGKMTID